MLINLQLSSWYFIACYYYTKVVCMLWTRGRDICRSGTVELTKIHAIRISINQLLTRN